MTRDEEIKIICDSLRPTLTNGAVTGERIRSVVYSLLTDQIVFMNGFTPLSEPEKLAIENEFAFQFLHVRSLKSITFSEPYEQWLEERKNGLQLRFWNDYKDHLFKSGFDKDAIDAIDETSDKILDFCGDPLKTGLGLRKGLVVGNVQSGKTADYIGVITKAADCGYRVIIVLAGLLNSLRSQTQKRIDEGFIGSSKVEVEGEVKGSRNLVDRLVGVGIGGKAATRPISVLSLTTLQSDFSGKTAKAITAMHGSNNNTVYVAVAKKNTTTLKNLIKWFGPVMCSYPMLLIDDEADNASINYKDEESPTTINRLIRDLLQKFPRSTYVGYTATPFANIFVNPDIVTEDHGEDLFPRDFVTVLDAPDHYMGPNRIFGDAIAPEDDILREITDASKLLTKKRDGESAVESLPPSCVRSLYLYILATAIRIAKGDVTCHSSALVNVGIKISLHQMIATLIRAEIAKIKNAVQVYGALPYDRNVVMTELRNQYELEYSNSGVSWERVQPCLGLATAPIEVVEVHMDGDVKELDYSRENYPNGRKLIAVGGFSLSRGLTLEGLCSSYVIRNSKMYDTLMQMGRWFGYRRGYGDLCRIHLTREAIGWYRHITLALNELWAEFRAMEAEKLIPAQFGLRVRAHPLNLIVTAKNKMKSATEVTVQVNLDGRHIEPNYFDIRSLDWNFSTLDRFISDIGSPNGNAAPCHGYYWTDVSLRRVQSFIRDSKRLDVNVDTATTPILNYLSNLEMEGVSACDVYLVSESEKGVECDVGGLKIRKEVFGIEVKNDGTLVVGGGRQHITSKDQERAGLSDVLSARSTQDEIADYLGNIGRSLPGSYYRRYRRRPLLVLHVVQGKISDGDEKPVVDCSRIAVWRLVFPGDASSYRPERLVSYVLNPIAARQYFRSFESLEDNLD